MTPFCLKTNVAVVVSTQPRFLLWPHIVHNRKYSLSRCCTSWKTNKLYNIAKVLKSRRFSFISEKICTDLSDTGMCSLFRVSICLIVIDFMRVHWTNTRVSSVSVRVMSSSFRLSCIYLHSGVALSSTHLYFLVFHKLRFHVTYSKLVS
jgi:hypothetical protein